MGDSGEYEEADAIASASVVPPGNAARIAGWIQEEIGGDLFSIQVQEPYPNWWYSCPMAIHSFIEEHDLSGKKIVLFCTHGTGGIAPSEEDIKDSLPEDCEVEENVLGVYRPEVTSSQNTVLEWLTDIGYEKQNVE